MRTGTVPRAPLMAPVDARWLARVGAVPRCPTGRLPIDFDRLLRGTPYDSNFGVARRFRRRTQLRGCLCGAERLVRTAPPCTA
jgi:hypothetical protein